MRIEPGDKTESIRTRGWTLWRHLFNPRQGYLRAFHRYCRHVPGGGEEHFPGPGPAGAMGVRPPAVPLSREEQANDPRISPLVRPPFPHGLLW